MPRDGSDVYNVPSGTYGIEDTTIESARYNAFVDDIAQDLNHPRPILAGGTGETSAFDALVALGGEFARQVVANYDSDVLQAGSIYSAASATSAPVAGHAFVGFVYLSDANNMVMQVRDQSDTVTPGRMYVREKKAGIWGAWKGAGEGGSSNTADMFFGLIGTSPNSQFVVNDKADASGTNVLTVAKSGTMTGDGIIKPGFMMDYGGPTAPAGWLVCDGAAVSRTTYAALFAAIGTTWGAGDGSNTFNLPALSNRFRRQVGNLAGAVGTLQAPANLAHTHGVVGTSSVESASHTHDMSHTTGTSNQSLNHSHSYTTSVQGAGTGTSPNYFYSSVAGATTGSADLTSHNHSFSGSTGAQQQNHTHNINFTSQGGSADNANEARPYSATVLTCIKT